MSEKISKPEETQEERQGYVPASPVKRTLAWIALAYALIFLALTTYFYFTGTMLGNLAPMLTIPGLVGLGVLAIVGWRTQGKPGKWGAIFLCLLCFGLAAATMPLAIAGFMSNFSTSMVGFAVIGG